MLDLKRGLFFYMPHQKKILILRCFSEPKLWENNGIFNVDQTEKAKALEWDQNLKCIFYSNVEFILGIYTESYFKNNLKFRFKKSISDDEKIITKLTLVDNNKFSVTDRFSIKIQFQKIGKLWEKPNMKLMFKLDADLLEAKKKEAIFAKMAVKDFEDPPIVYSLASNRAKRVLKSYNISVN